MHYAKWEKEEKKQNTLHVQKNGKKNDGRNASGSSTPQHITNTPQKKVLRSKFDNDEK